MQKKQLELVIENKNYKEFNGFIIRFNGFSKVPWRISRLGFAAGKHLLQKLKSTLGNFSLTIISEGNSTINKDTSPISVVLNYMDILKLGKDFRSRYSTEAEKSVSENLCEIFPLEFKSHYSVQVTEEIEKGLPTDVKEMAISNADIMDANKNLPLLSILEEHGIKSKAALKSLIAGRRVIHYLYLEKVLKEFGIRLKQDLKEQEWQDFFRKNLLILNPGYLVTIEKKNISLSIQFPDFIMLNIEDYADLFEIKLPKTPLLTYDKSHKNYYWSVDMCKAIAQVENYIESLTTNRDSLIVAIEKEYKLKLKILRPRGYIIAGNSHQYLMESKKSEDFKLLNGSLKNSEILPYDVFLQRFKKFSESLKQISLS